MMGVSVYCVRAWVRGVCEGVWGWGVWGGVGCVWGNVGVWGSVAEGDGVLLFYFAKKHARYASNEMWMDSMASVAGGLIWPQHHNTFS